MSCNTEAIRHDQRLHLDVARRTIRATLNGGLPVDEPVTLPSWVLDNVLQEAPAFDTPLRDEVTDRRLLAGLDDTPVSIPADELHRLLAEAGLLGSVEPSASLVGVA